MRVLMISFDAALAKQPPTDSRRRHERYAELCGYLTVIPFTRGGNPARIQATPYLTILPSNSQRQATFVVDAPRIAKQIIVPPDLIVTQDMFLTGLVGAQLKRRWNVPLLVQDHSFVFGNRAWLAEKRTRNRVLLRLASYVLKRADSVRTVNQQAAASVIKRGMPAERVTILPLATASQAFATPVSPDVLAEHRAALRLPPDAKIILWVGHPVRFKRVPLLFKVFQRVMSQDVNAHLVLIGDMRRSKVDLATLAEEEGIAERTIIHGPVAHEALPPYYQLADVYVHTSSYEGVPRVLMEAAAAGLPLVGFKAAGVDAVIDDGINGYLIKNGDLDGMAARLLDLLRQPELAAGMGAAGQQIALERYNADTYPERWVEVWRHALELGKR
jgi:glycosyltransferase involved in cell wall biosynthesis